MNSAASHFVLPRLKKTAPGMEKLDDLDWASGLAVTAYGICIGVRTNEPAVLAQLLERLPPGWAPASSPTVESLYSLKVKGVRGDRYHQLYADQQRLLRTTKLDQALETFESALELHVAEATPQRVFVHAGVVSWQGQAIVIPGRSYSGKTTLVAELVRAGATYYSDEYAVFDARGRVHPYPRPLGIRGQDNYTQTRCPVEALGGQAGSGPLPVALVLVSRYRPGATWRPRELSAGQGALALFDNTVCAQRRPLAALDALRLAVARARVLKGVRGEARHVIAACVAPNGR